MVTELLAAHAAGAAACLAAIGAGLNESARFELPYFIGLVAFMFGLYRGHTLRVASRDRAIAESQAQLAYPVVSLLLNAAKVRQELRSVFSVGHDVVNFALSQATGPESLDDAVKRAVDSCRTLDWLQQKGEEHHLRRSLKHAFKNIRERDRLDVAISSHEGFLNWYTVFVVICGLGALLIAYF